MIEKLFQLSSVLYNWQGKLTIILSYITYYISWLHTTSADFNSKQTADKYICKRPLFLTAICQLFVYCWSQLSFGALFPDRLNTWVRVKSDRIQNHFVISKHILVGTRRWRESWTKCIYRKYMHLENGVKQRKNNHPSAYQEISAVKFTKHKS